MQTSKKGVIASILKHFVRNKNINPFLYSRMNDIFD